MNFDWPSAKEVVLFLLAIYAAGLSTWNLRQSLLKDRRRVSVTVGTVMPTYGHRLGNAFAKVQATNIGQRPVTVTSLTLEVSKGQRLVQITFDPAISGYPDTSLPAVLNDGQSAHALFSFHDIGQALIGIGIVGETHLLPVCEDSVGTIHKGALWKVNAAELMGM